jgi:hypothetical protein
MDGSLRYKEKICYRAAAAATTTTTTPKEAEKEEKTQEFNCLIISTAFHNFLAQLIIRH